MPSEFDNSLVIRFKSILLWLEDSVNLGVTLEAVIGKDVPEEGFGSEDEVKSFEGFVTAFGEQEIEEVDEPQCKGDVLSGFGTEEYCGIEILLVFVEEHKDLWLCNEHERAPS